MKRGLLRAAVALVVGGVGGAGAMAHIERAAAPPAVMVGWKFDRNREGMLACRGLCERMFAGSTGSSTTRFAVAAPPEKTPEGCVEALRGACGVAP